MISSRSLSGRLCTASLCLVLASAGGMLRVSAQELLPGTLVVSTYGSTTSNTLLDGQPTPITLEDYDLTTPTTATLVTTDTLSNIVGEYGSSSEGTLQLSGNDEYLTIGGYDATTSNEGLGAPGNNGYQDATTSDPNGEALAQSASANVPRVADVVDDNGNVVSATSFSNTYTGDNIRGVYSADGSSVYVSGQAKGGSNVSEEGIFYSSTTGTSYSGSNTPNSIYSGVQDTRDVQEYGGNTYYSEDKTNTGIFEYSGTPTGTSGVQNTTSGTQITTANNGQTGNAQVNYSPEGFYFANASTLYVADTGVPKAGGVGDGGIQKWVATTNNGVTTWSLAYTLTPTYAAIGVSPAAGSTVFVNPASAYGFNENGTGSGQTGFEAVTGEVVNGIVYLYAVSYTAGDANANGLYEISDPLSATTTTGQSFTELESAPGDDTTGSIGDDNFKGVSFAPTAVPEPSSWAMMAGAFALLAFLHRRRARPPVQA